VYAGMTCEIFSDEIEVIDRSLTFGISSPSGNSPKKLTNPMILNASFDGATILGNAITDYRWYLDDILIRTGTTSITPAKARVYKWVALCCGVEKSATY